MSYILANLKSKMPILVSYEIEDILSRYNIVAKTDGSSDENIINFLNGSGYFSYEEYLIIDTYNDSKFDTTTYNDGVFNMSFTELLELIKINIRKVNIDKIID